MYVGETPYDHPWNEEPLPEVTAEALHELEREIGVYLEAVVLVRASQSSRLVERLRAYTLRT
jgi:hypothetical protein